MRAEVRTPDHAPVLPSRQRSRSAGPAPPAGAAVSRVIGVAVRHLIRAVVALDEADPVGERRCVGTVLLDLNVDGYRCVLTRSGPDPTAADGGCSALSPREHEVAQMVCAGLTNRAIASILDISPWTVGTHLRRIFVKFDVTSRAAMVTHFLSLADRSVPNRP